MQFLRISFHQWWLLEFGVHVQVSETDPIVENTRRKNEYEGEGPKIQLNMVIITVRFCIDRASFQIAHCQCHRIRQYGVYELRNRYCSKGNQGLDPW
jgi:hypothetical protein